MKQNAMELVFILDRSGSMYDLTDDTIGGFNSILDQQKAETAEIMVTTVLFNNRVYRLHDRVPAAEVNHITREDYDAAGSTALYDAVGSTIDHIEAIHRYIRPEDVPEKTLFVITTDGMENASTQYTRQQIKDRIERKQASDNWGFLFLAANIDTFETAESIGIRTSCSKSFLADSEGIDKMCKSVGKAVVLASRARYSAAKMDWGELLKDDEE